MKIALLIPFTGSREGWQWQDARENDISREYATKEEALSNRPEGYKCLNDGWEEI
jgi:hypothetical protein